WVDLSNASTDGPVALTEACEPAAFGPNSKDVLGGTYRKAAKFDASKFAISFDPHRCGLIGTIKDQLLEYNRTNTPPDCGIYKLNVYGKYPISGPNS
ncbi:hypothetical protein BDM02DRAFT_3102149, partial [Thelephora ganbajun]